MESDLQCPLCNNEYSAQNMPRLLTACGHTYCHSCLDTLIIEEGDQFRLQCPEDDIVVTLRSNDIAQFPKNIALIKLIDGKKHSSRDGSLEITNIQKQEDSHGNESEQEIINEIVSSERLESGRDEGKEVKDEERQREEKEGKEGKGARASPRRAEEELCLVHQKPLQIVCLVEMQKICSKCAIFGQHRGHEFKSIDQIEEECNLFHEDILNVYNAQEDILKQWDAINSKEVLEILEVNRKKIVKEVTDRYRRLREAVARSEEGMLGRIDEECGVLEQRIRATLRVDEAALKEYGRFESESFGVIIKFEESGLYEEKLRMLYDNTTSSLLLRGKDIVARIRAQHDGIFTQIERIINSIKVEYSEEDVLTALQGFARIRTEEAPEAKPQQERHIDESLLENENEEQLHYALASSLPAFNTPPPPQPVQSFAATGFPRQQQRVQRVQRVQQRAQERAVEVKPQVRFREVVGSGVEQGVSEKAQRPPKKKLKSIKVPQKFEKMLQALYNDTLETLDLTNAELGDAVVLQVCEFLRGTRVRTVKFIRNKLSDDAVGRMIAAFGGVVTLNLSQNFLTEQTLAHLANQRAAMPSLRTVILSQNRIIERKHRDFIERLKRTDLNVST